MKQLEQHIKDEIVITEDKQVLKQLKLLGSFRLQNGQKVWELNLSTKKITEAIYDSITIGTKNGIHKKLIIKDRCLYNIALNKKNSEKKFLNTLSKINTQ